jgi:hypothetical protein
LSSSPSHPLIPYPTIFFSLASLTFCLLDVYLFSIKTCGYHPHVLIS